MGYVMNNFTSVMIEDLVTEALEALESGGNEKFPLIDGRIVAVYANPDNGRSSRMAIGIAALPPDYCTPPHSHDAEEIAMIMRGDGEITIDGVPVAVRAGSIVVTPPNLVHQTRSSASGPLVVYWTYGPAGSEARWLTHQEADLI